ncbi:MAG: mandelate racemase/muconate lactonizing enzyme family protein [Chloroflexi bacterium]|nr:mandelate racemase/muconate lactonizing enzyme family protein [Chloroflexota bacterium]
MKLTGLAWRGYALPFRREYVTSWNRATVRRGILVFLETDGCLGGVGEASPAGTPGTDEIRRIATITERLAPGLLGKDISELEAAASGWDIPASLRFGLETALLDIRGRASRRPLTARLGGRPRPLAVNSLVAAESPEQASIEAREAVERGFTSLKLKVGRGSPERDEALVLAVRRVVGPRVKLRLDANQAWDRQGAIESIRRLERYDIEYIEQPVPAADTAGLAAVRSAVAMPVAADESLGSMSDLQELLRADAADTFIIKAARLGGLTAALDISKAAIAAGSSVVVTTSLESGVGIAAGAHLAAALPVQPYAHGLATGALFSEDLVSPPWLPSNGMLTVPGTPGLGVRVEPPLLEKYGTGIMGSAGSLSGIREYLSARRSGESPAPPC